MEHASNEMITVALRRPGSDGLLARGVLLDRETAYVVGVVDGLDDPSGFEVVVVAPGSRDVERVAPAAVHVARPGEVAGFAGLTLVRLASATRFEPPPLPHADPADVVLAVEARLNGSARSGRADRLAGTTATRPERDLLPGASAADLLLDPPAGSFPAGLVSGVTVDGEHTAVPTVTTTDLAVLAGIVRTVCLWIRWPCDYVPASDAELTEAADARRGPTP